MSQQPEHKQQPAPKRPLPNPRRKHAADAVLNYVEQNGGKIVLTDLNEIEMCARIGLFKYQLYSAIDDLHAGMRCVIREAGGNQTVVGANVIFKPIYVLELMQ